VGDSGAVGPVQGDGDAGGLVVDPATEVEQMAQDGPVRFPRGRERSTMAYRSRAGRNRCGA
jgi:hypothetical protein